MVKITGVKQTLAKVRRDVKREGLRKIPDETRVIEQRLRAATPVDTGRARDGWKSDGNSISNDVEYIDQLNRGHSQQAPAYFVERTVISHRGVTPSGIIVRKT